MKNSPDDLKTQVESFIGTAKREVEGLQNNIKEIEKLSKLLADYLCEDDSKFKLETCLSDLNSVVIEFETAIKVILSVNTV